MRNLKLLLLAALALTALAPVSRAADDESAPPPPPDQPDGGARMKKMRERQLKTLEEKLNLTAEQKTQILAIWDKTDEQMRALRKDTSASREEHHKKMTAIMESTRTQIRAVLTEEQQKIFDTLPKEGPRGGPPPDGGERPPPPPSE